MELWKHAPLEQPLRSNALGGIVRLYLAHALHAARIGLLALSEMEKEGPDKKMALMYPGLDEYLTVDAQTELSRLKRAIEKLMPPEVQSGFGMDTEPHATSTRQKLTWIPAPH